MAGGARVLHRHPIAGGGEPAMHVAMEDQGGRVPLDDPQQVGGVLDAVPAVVGVVRPPVERHDRVVQEQDGGALAGQDGGQVGELVAWDVPARPDQGRARAIATDERDVVVSGDAQAGGGGGPHPRREERLEPGPRVLRVDVVVAGDQQGRGRVQGGGERVAPHGELIVQRQGADVAGDGDEVGRHVPDGLDGQAGDVVVEVALAPEQAQVGGADGPLAEQIAPARRRQALEVQVRQVSDPHARAPT